MAYVSPTDHLDPDNKWNDEPKAYNGNITNHAWSDWVSPGQWSSFLELLHAALDCNKFRYYMEYGPSVTIIDFDAEYEGGWHDVFEGAIVLNTWVEISIPVGTKSVTKIRFRQYAPEFTARAAMADFDFWEVELVGRSFGLIMG